MRFPGFIGPSYTLSSTNYEAQRSMNLYPELDEIGTGKEGEVKALIGTPGLSLLAQVGAGPIRGMWYTSTGVLYVVSGYEVYSVSSSYVSTIVGKMLTNTGQVGMCDNGFQLVIVDGTYGYYVTLPGGSLTQITDLGFLGADVVTYQDGYFIFNQPGTKKFYISDLNAITFSSSVISSKSGNADNIISVISMNRSLWLLGDTTTEVWYDSGDNTNPFQYIQGTMMLYGCAAKFSPSKIANNLFWLGKDSTGVAVVLQASTYTPKRISNHAVEFAIQNYSKISDAIGFCYQENGHHFYVLTFPTDSKTWVYDLATEMWHERGYNNGGVFTRILSNCYVYAFGTTHITGDYKIGNIYNQSLTNYTDNGTPLIRQRTTAHLSKGMNRIFYKTLTLDFETSIGIDGNVQGSNPQAMLSWSDDGGHTWSNEHWSAMCPIGVTLERAIWRRLGKSRNRVFKVSISDPVKVVLIGAEIELELAAS